MRTDSRSILGRIARRWTDKGRTAYVFHYFLAGSLGAFLISQPDFPNNPLIIGATIGGTAALAAIIIDVAHALLNHPQTPIDQDNAQAKETKATQVYDYDARDDHYDIKWDDHN